MANCRAYQLMSVKEKIEYIGKLTHAVMNDSTCFGMGSGIVNYAQEAGIFEGIEILPERMNGNGIGENDPLISNIP